VRQALNCIANNTPVVLGLLMMEPDQAQRAVDYLAGATEALKGHCERIAESLFLFTLPGMSIEVGDSHPGSNVDQIEGGDSIAPLLGGWSE
jgi:FtsZ-interacting cell division protein YlmF